MKSRPGNANNGRIGLKFLNIAVLFSPACSLASIRQLINHSEAHRAGNIGEATCTCHEGRKVRWKTKQNGVAIPGKKSIPERRRSNPAKLVLSPADARHPPATPSSVQPSRFFYCSARGLRNTTSAESHTSLGCVIMPRSDWRGSWNRGWKRG